MDQQHVILVDELDRPRGSQDKLTAHQTGELHRAFSVFLFDRDDRWLLQQRHPRKYHSGGLWTNTCCSHPAPNEATAEAAHQRLNMEMGLEADLTAAFSFRYRAELDGDLIEHELDHVFIGYCDTDPRPNAQEVNSWSWRDEESLSRDLDERPELFTYWFRLAVPLVIKHRAQSLLIGRAG